MASHPQVQLYMKSPLGEPLGFLTIVARTPGSLFVLQEEEASKRGEEVIQLVEGKSYEFALDVEANPTYQLRETIAVQPSRISRRTGRIEPGLATGLLPIVLETPHLKEVARIHVEVRTSKIDYHNDYRLMLDYIASRSINLLMDIQAPSQIRLTSESRVESQMLHERYAFIRYLLTSQEFRDAVDRILVMPHHRTLVESLPADVRQRTRPSRSLMSSLSRGRQRTPLPPSHPLYRTMMSVGVPEPSLPIRVTANRSVDSHDTPENRFVKHALKDFLTVLLDIEERLSSNDSAANLRLIREVTPLRVNLEEYLEADLFKEVENCTVLPLGSPVLQRRSGYREILGAWFKLSLATKLSWNGSAEVFGAGKKDVALLYEYWLFFVLLDMVSETFHVDFPTSDSLMELTTNGFDMKLKAGSNISFLGAYTDGNYPISVRYSYNRTFPGKPSNSEGSYPLSGSWTRSMRPDFTLSLWPSEFTEEEAERQELMVHIHFDAKYRVESIMELFGSETDMEIDDEGRSSRTQTGPKRSDLLKMHAYRDAIRRTEGAYVLYPGPLAGDHTWVEFHEILPGLGAFSVCPGNEQIAKQSLSRFLRDIVVHLTNPTTRGHQLSYHIFRVQHLSEDYRKTSVLPANDHLGRRLRPAPSIENLDA